MSVHISSLVWRAKLGKATRKTVALKLADCADDKGGSVYPSLMRIAEEAECGRTTVHLNLKDFVGAGLLEVVEQGGGGAGDTTRYRFVMPVLRGLAEGELVVVDTDEGMRIVPAGTEPDGDGGKGSEFERSNGSEPEPFSEGKGSAAEHEGFSHRTLKGSAAEPEPSITRQGTVTLPPTPSGGVREGEVQLLLREVVEAKPERERVVDVLLGPLVRQRNFTAPDKTYALGAVADQALALGNAVLHDAGRRVLTKRKATFKPADVEDALREAIAADKAEQAAEAKRRADEVRQAEAQAKAAADAEHVQRMRAANVEIAAELERRGDGANLADEFAKELVGPIERSLFRTGGPNWTAPIIRDRAVGFLAARGVPLPESLREVQP